jgi:hypothetical protein
MSRGARCNRRSVPEPGSSDARALRLAKKRKRVLTTRELKALGALYGGSK